MWDSIKTGSYFFPHDIQDLIDHVQIKFVDQSCVLQGRDEIGRGQQSLFRIDPSCQRFHIANPFSDGADDRLEIHLYPFFLDCPVYILDDILPFRSAFTQILTVIFYGCFISAA